METIKFRIFDKQENQYCEEPDYRWLLSRKGKLYNSENDEWYDLGERFIVEFSTGLNNMKTIKQKAGEYARKIDEETQSSLHPKTASFQGFYDGYYQGFKDGENVANECIYPGWISIENEPKYLGRYLVKFDNGEVDVCWLSDKHRELNWYTHPECDIEFKIDVDTVKFYRTID